MKKRLFLLLTVFISFLFVAFLDTAFCAEGEYVEHNATGEIISVDFSSDSPTITIQYTSTDLNFVKNENKEIKLRIEDATKIIDSAGKEVKKEDLKVGDEVSATFRTKWNFQQKPLWRIATTITLKSLPSEAPQENVQQEKEQEEKPQDKEKGGLYY